MKNWKKMLALLLALVLCLAMFAGCGNKDEETETETESDTETDSETVVSEFDYSQGLSDDGFWTDVVAKDLVTLPDDYKNLVIPEADIAVTDEDVDEEITAICEDNTQDVEFTDRAVQNGDTVNIDYVGTLDEDGSQPDSMTGTKEDLVLGSGSMIDGFEDAIIEEGAFVGDTFDIHVTFPDSYTEELAGKDATFKITINSASETVVPEMTDAFAKELYGETLGVNSVSELRTLIKDELRESNIQSYIEDYLLDNAVASEIPDHMYTYQQEANAYYYEMMASYYGVDLETYLYYFTGCTTIDEVNEMYEDAYKQAVLYFLSCQAIAEENNLSVDEDDITAYFEETTGSSDYSQYESYYGKGYVTMVVLDYTALNFIQENAKFE